MILFINQFYKRMKKRDRVRFNIPPVVAASLRGEALHLIFLLLSSYNLVTLGLTGGFFLTVSQWWLLIWLYQVDFSTCHYLRTSLFYMCALVVGSSLGHRVSLWGSNCCGLLRGHYCGSSLGHVSTSYDGNTPHYLSFSLRYLHSGPNLV